MSLLEKLQVDLAEFFCEDAVSFKIEECFKSLESFCNKFKQVTNPAGLSLRKKRRTMRFSTADPLAGGKHETAE